MKSLNIFRSDFQPNADIIFNANYVKYNSFQHFFIYWNVKIWVIPNIYFELANVLTHPPHLVVKASIKADFYAKKVRVTSKNNVTIIKTYLRSKENHRFIFNNYPRLYWLIHEYWILGCCFVPSHNTDINLTEKVLLNTAISFIPQQIFLYSLYVFVFLKLFKFCGSHCLAKSARIYNMIQHRFKQ